MEFKRSKLEGVIEIIPNVFGDERGYFLESYNKDLFSKNGIDISFVQDNQSLSSKNVVRGLHFQAPPFAQDKIVRVIKGSVVDVVVDIRKNSPTYGQFETYTLTEEKKNMLLVPKGFAHGFVTLEDNTIFVYKCSNIYNKESEGGILWNSLDINWHVENPLVSDKDKILPKFSEFITPFV